MDQAYSDIIELDWLIKTISTNFKALSIVSHPPLTTFISLENVKKEKVSLSKWRHQSFITSMMIIYKVAAP